MSCVASTMSPTPATGAVGTRPLPHDERALVLAARQAPGRARAELVDVFLPRIASVAREYRGVRAVSREELMQAGVMGLLTALVRFDPARGSYFWAYASWWVRQAMQDLVSSLSNVVVLSDRALRHLACVNKARRDYLQRHRREPSLRELAALTGLSSATISRLMVATRPARALEPDLGGDHRETTPRWENLRDPAAEDAFELATIRLSASALPAALATLAPRELAVVRGRYGIDRDPRSLRELATELSLSAERVRQIEQIALRKLQEWCDATATAA